MMMFSHVQFHVTLNQMIRDLQPKVKVTEKTVIRLYNWKKSLLLGLKYAIFLNLSLN